MKYEVLLKVVNWDISTF